MMDEEDSAKWEKEFMEKFTYIDMHGNHRMNNQSPKKVKAFIRSVLRKERVKLQLDILKMLLNY